MARTRRSHGSDAARRAWRALVPLDARMRARDVRRRARIAVRPYPRFGAAETIVDFRAMTPAELQSYADSLGSWTHEIALPGVENRNAVAKSREFMEYEWGAMLLPDLQDKTVIDVGGADGGYAFMAEEMGAKRVAIMDCYEWSLDRLPAHEYYLAHRNRDEWPPKPLHETEHWRPHELPGKRNFNFAHALLESRVEPFASDFMRCNLERIGEWDIVLFLGLLYHLDDPLGALRRLRAITREQAIIETEALAIPGHDEPLWRLYPHAELNYDWTNWWAPNLSGLLAGLGAAGFSNTDVLQGPPDDVQETQGYRLIVRATR